MFYCYFFFILAACSSETGAGAATVPAASAAQWCRPRNSALLNSLPHMAHTTTAGRPCACSSSCSAADLCFDMAHKGPNMGRPQLDVEDASVSSLPSMSTTSCSSSRDAARLGAVCRCRTMLNAISLFGRGSRGKRTPLPRGRPGRPCASCGCSRREW